MKRNILYPFIIVILLVSLFGVQAMAQNKYILPDNRGWVTMKDILKENPSLKEEKIYGDIQRDNNGDPSSSALFYGGTRSGGTLILNDSDRYGTDNPDITFGRNNNDGLTLTSKNGEPIQKAILYLAEYNHTQGWCKTATSIILEHHDSATGMDTTPKEAIDTMKMTVSPDDSKPNPDPDPPYPWWTWFLGGCLSGVILSLILMWKTIVPQTKISTGEAKQVQDVGKLPNSEEKSLGEDEVEQVVNRIVEKYSSELFEKISKLVDEKIVSFGSEKKTQNNTILKVPASTRSVKETKKVQGLETEEFCGYAQLPQNGDFALTITQDPARTAFVISKRGSDYFVGLIDDEQTLSQLVQPLSDLKANGSNIVDFPEGELQGAQKIVCVHKGVFKEESTGRIIPVKPIQIKRG